MDERTTCDRRRARTARAIGLQAGLRMALVVGVISLFGRCGVAGHHCPRCAAHCQFSIDDAEQSRHCWKVEWEEVCVPKVVFPWQNHGLWKRLHRGCTNPSCTDAGGTGAGCSSCSVGERCGQVKHNGATVIKVRRLKKHKYTCPKCEYSWDVEKPGCTDACSAWLDETAEESPEEAETAADDTQGDQAAMDDPSADVPAANEPATDEPANDANDDRIADEFSAEEADLGDDEAEHGSTEKDGPTEYLPEMPPEPGLVPTHGAMGRHRRPATDAESAAA